MKKLTGLVLVTAVVMVLFPFGLFAAMRYFSLDTMDTALMRENGKFTVSILSDNAFYGTASDKALMLLDEGAGLSYVLIDGLEAEVDYMTSISLTKVTDITPGMGKASLRYAAALGDTAAVSLQLEFGAPLNKDIPLMTVSGPGEMQITPQLCGTLKLGGMALNLMVADTIEPDSCNWLKTCAAAAFDIGDNILALSVLADTPAGTWDSAAMFGGGAEFIWGVNGPLMVDLGLNVTKYPDTVFYRLLLKLTLLP